MAQELDLELKDIYKLGERLAAKNLAGSDWSVLSALVTAFAERVEVRLARAGAKAIAAQAAAEAAAARSADGAIVVAHSDHSEQGADPGAASHGPGGGTPNPKPRNHGRNGAGAYTAAKHIYRALLAGIIGALCKACKAGPMSAYREKITIRIVGQPLLAHCLEHHEDLARRPEHYLPWAYRDRLDNAGAGPPLS